MVALTKVAVPGWRYRTKMPVKPSPDTSVPDDTVDGIPEKVTSPVMASYCAVAPVGRLENAVPVRFGESASP